MQYLRYIQPTGNRQTYSNTNLSINDMDFRFEFEYLYLEEQITSGDWSECLGTGHPYKFRFGSNPEIFVAYGGNDVKAPRGTILDGAVIIDKTGLWCNGTKVIDISSPSSYISSNPLTIGGDYQYAGDALVKGNSKLGRLKVYHSNTLVADFVPADDNGTIGWYDEVSQTFYDSDGSQPWIAGPVATSISVDASKSTLASTGETISISVSCENAWTVTGDTFLTLSSTGDTGSTTITATAPSYTGATARTDTLTFTDSVTGDEAEITIKQKKYSTGQPFYLGADEIVEIYLGDDSISEAYLGEDLVFSTGPFMGLKVIPMSIGFKPYYLSGTTKVKSSEPWQITSNPLWITASPTTGDSGETIVTLVSDELSAVTSGSVMFESNSYSASLETSFEMVQFVDAIRDNSAPNWDLSKYLDTGIYVTNNIGTTIRVKYIGGGEFSDRIVGFDGTETGGNDDTDFRYFPPMADAGSQRIDSLPYSLYESDVEQDITLGNLWVYDNKAQQTIASTLTGGTISDNTTIRVDMSTNWIEEVIISVNNTRVFDGKAAYLNGEYGMYDTVSNTFLTDATLNIVPRTAPTPPTPTGSTRTLEITDIPTPPIPTGGESPNTWIQIQDPDNGQVELAIDWNDNDSEYDAVVTANDWEGDPLTAITATYSNGTLTAEGDWGDYITIQYAYYDEGINCEKIPDDKSFVEETFTGDTISLAFPTLEVNGECQCGKDGGEWDSDNNVCVHPTGLLLRLSSIPDDGNVHTVTITDADSRVCTLSIDMSGYSYTESADADGKYSVHMENDDIANCIAEWMIEGNMYGTYVITVDGTPLPNEPDYDGSGNFVLVTYDYNDDTMTNYCSRDAFDCENGGGTYDCQTGECSGAF